MIDYRALLLLLTAGANLSLALFILLKSPKNRINILFSLMLFFIALWSFVLGLFLATSDYTTATYLSMLIYLSAAFIAFIFYFFTIYFPYQISKISKVNKYAHLAFLILIIIIISYFKVEFIVAEPVIMPLNSKMNPVPYSLYVIYFLSYIIASFHALYSKFRESTSTHRKVLKIVLFSTLLSAFFGSIFNLFLPIFTYDYIWIGPLFTLMMVFIIVKYIFLNED